MYFNVGKGFATIHVKVMLILFYNLLVLNRVYANESKALASVPLNFTAQPEQCVTLRQGRACFATVELQWQSSTKESFCLYQVGKNKQLGCWQENNNMQIKIEFESNNSIKYQLRSVSDNKVIAETQVEVSWQHKNISRKRRWRLF